MELREESAAAEVGEKGRPVKEGEQSGERAREKREREKRERRFRTAEGFYKRSKLKDSKIHPRGGAGTRDIKTLPRS